ncbi:MAG: hypothetical protein HY834_09765 [Devosia nanyangense]|uniref:Tetratricopeptide repeat protein n=1 Tax=Devosia nanyangense TaxID=1228055 RepID=A0A933NWL4_9HYPH|nr:hypothetical protein [Devosia nanyangense]
MPKVAPSAEQVRAALDELLGWQGISRSPQIAELLRYVVEKRLAGEEASIKAYSIAVDVLGRPQSFDPQADPIVRVQARRLRTLLEQFYEIGRVRAAVRITMPLGRYVPEFTLIEAAPPDAPAGSGPPAARRGGWRLPRILQLGLLGLGFTVIGVALTVAIVRWMLPEMRPPPEATLPEVPRIAVGAFDNLTGDSELDGLVAGLGPQIGTSLSRFDTLSVVTDSGLMLRGSVQETGGQFEISAILAQHDAGGPIWSDKIVAPTGVDAAAALADLATALAARLGNSGGPLYAPGRLWLAQQGTTPEQPSLYVCQLQFMAWRDNNRLEDDLAGTDCFERILAAEPNNAIARAGRASLKAWRVQNEAAPGTQLADLLADEMAAISRAVGIGSQSSFVYEQQGLILARAGSADAAFGALHKARELNPANMDAEAEEGLLRWLDGQFDGGAVLAEAAIAAVASPPPWYYTTRVFEALRELRYFDAIEAAQALAAGDDEFGPVIALAAAPRVGRNDLVDRYRPVVLGHPRFQAAGILPRLGMFVHQQVLLDRIRDGLTLAGIPPNALIKPFNPDGTEKK